ncbi:MAG: hypothetical protein PHC95_11045 [Parabacteroides sp.]|nr:hypothetical protein [Parabacteroides sp.]
MPDYSHLSFFSSTHILAGVAFICAWVLWAQRKQGERSRAILAGTWAFIAILYLLLSMMLYGDKEPHLGIMPITPLITGFYSVILILVYPVEVVSPLWLNLKRLVWLFSPALLATTLIIFMELFGFEFRRINTFDEFGKFLYEPNVWLRVLITIAIIVYAAIIIFYIPRNKIHGNTTLTWMLAYTVGNLGICVLYLGRVLWGVYPFGVIHTIYLIAFIVITTYQELFVRLFIIQQEKPAAIAYSKPMETSREEPEPISDKSIQLWNKLQTYMKDERPWLNPNITLEIIAYGVQSNRTTVTELIQQKGYDGFYDYIGTYRIDEFCKIARTEYAVNIQETFFNVGFRSKTTAFRQFKKQMKRTPSQWLIEVNNGRA